MRTEDVKEGAREVGGAVAGEQKHALARQVLGVARALDAAAEELRSQDQGSFADLADRAAEATRRFGQDMEGKGFKELLGELERLGREQPALMTAGAAVAGFLAARVARQTGDSEDKEGVESYGAGA